MAKKQPGVEKQPNFENQMKRLQEIVEQLEDMDIPLSTNVALYKEGKALAASCMQLLEQAKNEVRLCDKETLVPFASSAQDDEAEDEAVAGFGSGAGSDFDTTPE